MKYGILAFKLGHFQPWKQILNVILSTKTTTDFFKIELVAKYRFEL
jgi:hypothetical protein